MSGSSSASSAGGVKGGPRAVWVGGVSPRGAAASAPVARWWPSRDHASSRVGSHDMNPFKAIENIVLGPPRLFVRTLDDFHTLVEIADDTNKRLDRIERLAMEMTQQLAILVKLVGVLEQG